MAGNFRQNSIDQGFDDRTFDIGPAHGHGDLARSSPLGQRFDLTTMLRRNVFHGHFGDNRHAMRAIDDPHQRIERTGFERIVRGDLPFGLAQLDDLVTHTMPRT